MFDRKDAYRPPRDGSRPARMETPGGPGRQAGTDLLGYLYALGSRAPLTAQTQAGVMQDDFPHMREGMARANRGLVAAIASRYAGRGLEMAELLEAGNSGLRCAVAGFDPQQGALFSTYASWWIKQAIKRALLNTARPGYAPGRKD